MQPKHAGRPWTVQMFHPQSSTVRGATTSGNGGHIPFAQPVDSSLTGGTFGGGSGQVPCSIHVE
jgi:hypothetical protein